MFSKHHMPGCVLEEVGRFLGEFGELEGRAWVWVELVGMGMWKGDGEKGKRGSYRVL